MKTRKTIYTAIMTVVAIAATYTAGFMLKAGEPDKLWWWALGLAFFAWACLPYLLVLRFMQKSKDNTPALAVALLTVAIMAGGGFFILWQAFVTHLDAQSGIVFVFLPGYQLAAAIIGLAVARVLKTITRKRTKPPPPPYSSPAAGSESGEA